MPMHRVQQGECLASIGALYGIPWQRIWDHPDNEELKQRRKSPHVLLPGDTLHVPDKAEKTIDMQTGAAHKIKVRRPTVPLRLLLQKGNGDPLAGKRYRLEVGVLIREGQTADDGLVEEEIPADAEAGSLTLWLDDREDGPTRVIPLRIGHLDPAESKSGLEARLKNLGYSVPEDDHGRRKALAAFQKAHDLEAHGDLDDNTKTKLFDLHGA
jgi:hypothetical protein